MFDVSRRDLILGAAGAYAAFGLDRPIAFVDAAHAQTSATPPFRRYQVGDIEVFSLIDGMRDVPLREGMVRNASVDQVKAALRAAGFADNQAPSRFIVMALKRRDQVVLINSGTGGHSMYGRGTGRLFESMAAAGLDPKAVKTILISHLHGDHIYGLMNNESDAQVFPDADIVVPSAELKWWTRPGVESLDLGPTRKGSSQANSGDDCELEKRQDLRGRTRTSAGRAGNPGARPQPRNGRASRRLRRQAVPDQRRRGQSFTPHCRNSRMAANNRPGSGNGCRNAKEDL